MSEVVLTEQLDRAIEAMLRTLETPSSDPQVAELLGIASELRALPRAEFKAQLKIELEGEAAMTTTTDTESSVQPVREGFRTVTPYITVADVKAEIGFLTQAFGAEGHIYGLGSAGGFHSEYRIGDSMIMVGGGGEGATWKGPPMPGSLHLYVDDVDAVYERAMQAGAISLMAPTDQEYGDRDASVVDVGGNHWYIGTHKGAAYKPEGVSDLMPYLHPTGAPKMINFLKQAFGAEEIFAYRSPDGVVHHAKIGIGDSIVEMGEAHAQWQPMPMTFMLYVEDCDAWYARAMNAEGTISISAPANQDYGGRVGAVKDPFDNIWYLGTQIAAKE
jgi:uncharacterized glyoxalase superfamily protein PhnB